MSHRIGSTDPPHSCPAPHFKTVFKNLQSYVFIRRSQWSRGLRRRSTAARLLRLWFRIPPGAWTSVCCACYVLSGRGLCDALITRPEESYRLWCVVVCDLETSRMRRPWPALGCSATEKKIFILHMSPKMKVWLERHPITSFSVQTFQIHFVHTLSAMCPWFARLFWLLHIVHGTAFIVLLKYVFKRAHGCCTYIMSYNEQPRVPSDFNVPGCIC